MDFSFIFDLLPFLFFISFFIFGLFYAYKVAENTKQKFIQLAKGLGMEFQDGKKNIENINDFANKEKTSPLLLQVTKFISNFVSDPRITGTYSGEPIQIYTEIHGSGKNRTTYTIIHLKTNNPLPYQLEISKQGMIQGFFIKLFNIDDIQVGDEKFDKSFVIKGDNQIEIKKLCLNPSVQKSIYEHMQIDGLRILNNGIHFQRQGYYTDLEFYKNLLPEMSALAKNIYSQNSEF